MKESYRKKWIWIGIGCFLVRWAFTFGTPDLWAARPDQIEKDITQKKKDLKDIKKEISITKEKEKEIRGKESSILGNLHLLEMELYQKEKELKQMESQLVQTRERLQQIKNQISLLSKRTERTKEELFSRLIALYKMERIPTEGFLFASHSFFCVLLRKVFPLFSSTDFLAFFWIFPSLLLCLTHFFAGFFRHHVKTSLF